MLFGTLPLPMNIRPCCACFLSGLFCTFSPPVALSQAVPQTVSQTGEPAPHAPAPVVLSVYERARVDATQWFAATPHAKQYGYGESLLRIALAQRIRRFDWQLELAQGSVFLLPPDAVSPVAAQGQLGLGGTYYAANANGRNNAAASFKQGFLRYRFAHDHSAIRLGRFEFFDGLETRPANPTLDWLDTNRIAQRLVGNFGFSTGQRSFDGVDAHTGGTRWNLAAMAARPTGGVYNMNANPELNVDVEYLALTRYGWKERLQLRGFALGYHDGRTGVVKTDNRALAVRQADHRNIRIGTYGGNAAAAIPAGRGTLDLMSWGVLQNGDWGVLNHRAGAFAVEGGYHATTVRTEPWLRIGWDRSTGDSNPLDREHNTFFQVLPTPRLYARFPFFNLMNTGDRFVQLIDKPARKLELRADFHALDLTSGQDLWYNGGGAFDGKVFGYAGRPGNRRNSFATFADLSADYALTPRLTLSGYYGKAWGRSVVRAIFPSTTGAQFGFFEATYRWSRPLGH